MNSKDGIIGLAVGDAMGVPIEFMSRDKLMDNPVTQMLDRGSHNQPKGTWSDDTSLTLATMDSIIHCFGISTEDMGNRFVNWMEKSEYTATGERFDIGRTTLIALAKFEKEGHPFESGSSAEDSNGNGSLMRMLPIAYYCYSAHLQPNDILDVVKKVKFDQIYMFIYSRRVGTPGDKMENQIPEDIKHKRFDRLKQLVESQISERNKEYVGTVQKILVEGRSKTNDNMLTGRSDSNKVVILEGCDELVGKMVEIKIVSEHMWYLKGQII